MKCDKLFDTIDLLYKPYLKIWEEACNIESPTDFKAGVDAVGNFFINIAKAHGWQVEVFHQPIAGDVVCITMNPDAKANPISLSGHIDTVHACGSFGTPAVRFDDEKIYGPGVADCKGGIVAGIMAMDALSKCGFTNRPIQLLLQTDEETGSKLSKKATINYICEKAKSSAAFLNLEGHTAGEACLSRKGIVSFAFTVTGKEGHSSRCYMEGANAIADAAHKILELEKFKDGDGITCNCGVINGGTAPNTVPGKCEFIANVRFVTDEQLKWMREYVDHLAKTVHIEGCSCSVSELSGRVAMELVDRNVELLEKMNSIFAKNGLPVLKASRGNGGSDAADVTAYGIPCVDSVGVEYGRIHSKQEYAVLQSLKQAAKRIAATIYCF